jgi:hypothetical protein
LADKSTTSSFDQICRRAGGRRRYNLQRQLNAMQRQKEVARLFREFGHVRGFQAQLARALGVSESTISRDLENIKILVFEDDVP